MYGTMYVMDLTVEACGLTKRYGKMQALAGVDLAVERGTVLGLLGPNGAGKTTAVRILTTLLRPDGGSARIAGFDVVTQAAQVRYRVGLVGQHAAVDEILSGRQNLQLFGRLYHLPTALARTRADVLLHRFGLADTGSRPVGTYSGGMRRRLDLATSLILAPEVLFLDEPTAGLDPHSRNEVWAAVRALVADGTTIVLSTQYLEETDQLADQVCVLDHGQVIAHGPTERLKSALGGARVDVVVTRAGQLEDAAAAVAAATGGPVETDRDACRVSTRVTDPARALTAVVRALDAAGVDARDVGVRRPTLDEVFLHLTGTPTTDEQESRA